MMAGVEVEGRIEAIESSGLSVRPDNELPSWSGLCACGHGQPALCPGVVLVTL